MLDMIHCPLPQVTSQTAPVTSVTAAPAALLGLKAKILCLLGWKLAQCGAETRLIMQSVQIMVKALQLKAEDCEFGFDRTGVHVKLSHAGHSAHEYRAISHFGINMSAVSAIYRLCLAAEKSQDGVDAKAIYQQIKDIKLKTYPVFLTASTAAAAAACFTALNGGTANAALAACAGGLLLMVTRLQLLKRRYFEIFAVMCAAFTGCLGAAATACLLGLPAEQINLAMMAASLLLVPGFPFMNGFLDIFKGYLATGITRLTYALTIIFGAAIGIMGAILFCDALGILNPTW